MSGEIVEFKSMDKAALTAYLSSPEIAAAAALNDDVANFQSYPGISIKGGRFTLVQGDERQVMLRPGSDEPAQSLNLVILRANDKSRTYYEKPYDPNEYPPAKPTCYSNDNVAPSDLSLEKQSPQCQTCRWAVFGTAIKQDGTAGKGTRCQSNARLAVAAPDALDKPYILRAPATSLRPLRDAIEVIRKRNIPYPLVVMKISFLPDEASPTLKFIPSGLVSQADAQKALGMREDSVVRAICGLDERKAAPALPAPVAPVEPANELTAGLDAALAQRAAAPTPAPATPAEPKTSPPAATQTQATPPAVVASMPTPSAGAAPTTVTSPAPSPVAPAQTSAAATSANGAPPATPSAAPSQVTVATGNLLSELGGLLGTLDD